MSLVGNVSSSGSLSSISPIYPFVSPSLYTLIVYSTISPIFTPTGSFVCTYLAVVSLVPFGFRFVMSTSGILEPISLLPTPVMNFLKA